MATTATSCVSFAKVTARAFWLNRRLSVRPRNLRSPRSCPDSRSRHLRSAYLVLYPSPSWFERQCFPEYLPHGTAACTRWLGQRASQSTAGESVLSRRPLSRTEPQSVLRYPGSTQLCVPDSYPSAPSHAQSDLQRRPRDQSC